MCKILIAHKSLDSDMILFRPGSGIDNDHRTQCLPELNRNNPFKICRVYKQIMINAFSMFS